MLAGALQEPVDGALFVFKGASVEEIESFVAAVSLQSPFWVVAAVKTAAFMVRSVSQQPAYVQHSHTAAAHRQPFSSARYGAVAEHAVLHR